MAGRIYKLCAKHTSNPGFDRTFMLCSGYFYALPNNERGTKYRGLTYSANQTVREICRATYSVSQTGLRIYLTRSKKRIKGQNFCQTIDYLSFHRFYQSIKRQICHYFITFSCATFCINKTARCRKEYTRLDR